MKTMEGHNNSKNAKIVYAKVPDNFDKLTDELMEITMNLPTPKKNSR